LDASQRLGSQNGLTFTRSSGVQGEFGGPGGYRLNPVQGDNEAIHVVQAAAASGTLASQDAALRAYFIANPHLIAQSLPHLPQFFARNPDLIP